MICSLLVREITNLTRRNLESLHRTVESILGHTQRGETINSRALIPFHRLATLSTYLQSSRRPTVLSLCSGDNFVKTCVFLGGCALGAEPLEKLPSKCHKDCDSKCFYSSHRMIDICDSSDYISWAGFQTLSQALTKPCLWVREYSHLEKVQCLHTFDTLRASVYSLTGSLIYLPCRLSQTECYPCSWGAWTLPTLPH